MDYSVKQVGTIHCAGDGFYLQLEKEYIPAMAGLAGFEYLQLLWWFSGCDDAPSRAVRTVSKPYTHGPDALGVFATRSPQRPNPLALSAAAVTYLDEAHGVIGLAWVDAQDGSPVLDVKPYLPSVDRVETPAVPAWCAHWPVSVEESGDFDWESEFNF